MIDIHAAVENMPGWLPNVLFLAYLGVWWGTDGTGAWRPVLIILGAAVVVTISIRFFGTVGEVGGE